MDESYPYDDCFYNFERAVPDADVVAFVTSLFDVDAETVRSYRDDLRSNTRFRTAIKETLRKTEYRPTDVLETWRDAVYVLFRIHEPGTVVETGVFDGLSSAYILQALRDNGRGELISIDIEDEQLLPADLDAAETGWAVPSNLRTRWDLRIGDARELLPDVVAETDVDAFLHDSNHDADHMRFEFSTVEPGMPSGSVFLADNVEYNDVFEEFAATALRNVATLLNADRSLQRDGGTVTDDKLGAGIVR